jgi:tetratricopeptide (TPR) repeat protein
MWALIDGRLADYDETIEREVKLASGDSWVLWNRLFRLRYEQGRLGEMRDLLDRLEPRLQPGASRIEPYLWRSARLVCWLESDRERAAVELRALGEREFTDIPYDPGWFEFMALVSDACVELNDRQQAETLYRLIMPLRSLLFLYTYASTCWAAAEHYLGLLATVLERWPEAEEHLQKAIEIHHRGGMRLWHAHSQYAYADMLVRRGEPGDQEQALGLVDRALAEAEAMGAARLARQALALKVRVQGILKA